jgi:predicted transcriptional regulator
MSTPPDTPSKFRRKPKLPVTMTLRVSRSTKAAILEEAEARGVDLSQIAREAIEHYLARPAR